MDAATQGKLLAELKYEMDMLYVATDMVLSPNTRNTPSTACSSRCAYFISGSYGISSMWEGKTEILPFEMF